MRPTLITPHLAGVQHRPPRDLHASGTLPSATSPSIPNTWAKPATPPVAEPSGNGVPRPHPSTLPSPDLGHAPAAGATAHRAGRGRVTARRPA